MSKVMQQIVQAYQAEPKDRSLPVAAGALPLSYEAITPEWLTPIMCAGFPGARVEAVTLGEPDSGSANRRKLSLRYNAIGEKAGLCRGLFCKASHELNNRLLLGIGGAIVSETFFYNEIRPNLDIDAPRCFFAGYDPESFNSLIILEDLTDQVISFCSHRTYINKACAESQMALLARLHGRYNGTSEFIGAKTKPSTWPGYFYNIAAVGMEQASTNGFLAAREVIPERLFARADEIWAATLQSVEDHHALPWTLCHNDVHVKNWYLASVNTMGLSDWQCLTFGHWSRDIAYVLASSLTVENRRDWERELIGYYLQQLAENGIPGIDVDFAWTQYRRQMMSSLTWWTGTLTPSPQMPSDIQPRDITLEMIHRIATAIDDLDVLDDFT